MLTQGVVLSNRYRLGERVATGGMGAVWRCVDTLLDREVAVKVLLPALVEDPEFTSRFHAEARMMAALRHPGIVAVHDFGSATLADGSQVSYLVMEYVDGEPLVTWIRRAGRLDPTSTMSVVAQAAAALHAAHTAGIVHRDVKPGNLLVKRDGTVVLVDFGIARSSTMASLTAAHMVLGTASYMSPEQAVGQPVSAATDVYALGAVAYYCLTGQPPFVGENPLQVALRHAQEEPAPLPPSTPPAVAEVVARALAKSPGDRWPSAAALADAALDARDATLAVLRVPPRPPWALEGPALPTPTGPSTPSGTAVAGDSSGAAGDPSGAASTGPRSSGAETGSGAVPAGPPTPPGAGTGALSAASSTPPAPPAGPDRRLGAGAAPLPPAVPGTGPARVAGPGPAAGPGPGPAHDGAAPAGRPDHPGGGGTGTGPETMAPQWRQSGPPATPPGGAPAPTGYPAGAPLPAPGKPYPGGPYPAVVGGQQATPPAGYPSRYVVPETTPTREDRAGGAARRRRLALAGAAGGVVAVLAAVAAVVALQPDEPARGGPALTAESESAAPVLPGPSVSTRGGKPRPSASATGSRSASATPTAGSTGTTTGPGPSAAPTTSAPQPGTTTTPPARTNPYTPAQVCGSGYQVIDSASLTANGIRRGKVYLLWNEAAKANCVVTMKVTAVGERTTASAFLEVQGKTRATDSGAFEYYAGPVRAGAGGTCVKWGGATGGASYASGFEHCG
ncbi:protein kinase [Micromonospora purpureochromogenes]|uniref:serine/threonine-protein kinase n=1 Tax=Micromonospora purpureochromogenes TaxID=47872 RepID=UPI0033FFBF8F